MNNENNLNVAIAGAGGRMGQTLLELTANDEELRLSGALEADGVDAIGKPVSELADCSSDIAVSSNIRSVLDSSEVLIDFTHPDATEDFLKTTKELQTPLVIGTTGLSSEQEDLLDEVATTTPIVKAPNMSVGINLLVNLVAEATDTLGEGFDAEVLEMHHRHKTDAPSGTANLLANTVAETRNQDLENKKNIGREGFIGEREDDEIGIASLRGGDVVGDHTVILAGEGERIELTHKASSRKTFAKGALRAAKFASDKNSGRFSMQDVLGF